MPTVIIVSYQTPEETLAAVLSALRTGTAVVVIDNASGDASVERLRSLDSCDLTLIESKDNQGFGSAANRAVSNATTENLLFLNSDAVLHGDALAQLASELERSRGRAIVGPRLIGSDHVVQRSAGLLPEPSDLTVRALGLHAVGRWLTGIPVVRALVRRTRLAREYASADTATETIDTNMVSGACLAIGRVAFEELGGFDERFFMYFEDADLCRRAAAAGMPIRYVPAAVVSHVGGASSSEDYHFGPLHARSMRQYLGKWYGPGGSALALLLLWLRAIGFSVALRPGAKRAWRALWAAIRDEDPRR